MSSTFCWSVRTINFSCLSSLHLQLYDVTGDMTFGQLIADERNEPQISVELLQKWYLTEEGKGSVCWRFGLCGCVGAGRSIFLLVQVRSPLEVINVCRHAFCSTIPLVYSLLRASQVHLLSHMTASPWSIIMFLAVSTQT